MENKEIDVVKEILAGKVFIYPTDTIYGIGCDATNEKAVEKIKQIKSRDRDKPLSVIAPSFEWIENNFIINLDIKKYLPGPYTLLLKKKDICFLKWISPNDRIGVRIPGNEFTKKIQASNLPFVTTSVNLSGEPFALSLKDIKEEVLKEVDYIIEGDNLSGKPSTLIIDGKEIFR